MPALPNNRGVLLREVGLLDQALAAFTGAVRLKPDYGNALENQGNALELLGRFDEAEGVYRTLLSFEPQRATAWNNLGNCASQLSRPDEARDCYERAVQLDPDYVFALVNLAGLLDHSGERGRAQALVERALTLDPSDEMALRLHERFQNRAATQRLEPPAWDVHTVLPWIGAVAAIHNAVQERERESGVVPRLLERSRQLADRTGFLTWRPDRLAADPVSDPGPQVARLSPKPTPQEPRLFIAYAWNRDDPSRLDGAYESDIVTYAIAGNLFNRGYRIMFDRDPRNLDKGLDDIHVLRRLYDCNYYVPVVTARYVEKVARSAPPSLVKAEWELAGQLRDAGYLVFAGILLAGQVLPPSLDASNTVDVRQGGNLSPALVEAFPDAPPGGVGIPRILAPERPPEPADWPAHAGG